MELHAYTRTLSELLSVNRKYIVPRFQREYSWVKEQIHELWYDVVSNIKINESGELINNEYFIGSLVLVGDETGQEMQIVDGQQRLTTITIFLSVLCDCFNSIGKEQLAEALFQNYIEGKDDNGQHFFKLINETPKPFFQRNIQFLKKFDDTPESTEEKNLLAAYKEITTLASKETLNSHFGIKITNDDDYESFLKAIRDQILRFLKIIFITVNDEDEAYTIFETLNARGMNLTFVDLIKNELFKALKSDHPSDEAKDNWRKIRSILTNRTGTGTIESYIRHWWASKYAFVNNDNLYRSFIKRWRNGEIEPITFIQELVEDAKIYSIISSPLETDFPQIEDKKIYNSLNALRLFGITQCRPFILALFKAKSKGKLRHRDMINAMVLIEKFHFMFNAVCSLRPSGIEGAYSKAARSINDPSSSKESNGQVIEQLSALLSNRKPELTVFTEKFSDILFTNEKTKQKKLIQYIISQIETSRHPHAELKPDSITLEHIESQSNGNSKEIGMIGNLLPLSKRLNEMAENKNVAQKIAIYSQSEYAMVAEFVSEYGGLYNNNWSESEIKDKTDRLSGEAYMSIWNH